MPSDTFPNRIRFSEASHDTELFFGLSVSCTDAIPLHCHSFIELDMILSGSGIQCLNGKEKPVSAGTVTVLSSSDFHSYYVKDGAAFTTFSLHIREDFAEKDLLPMLSSLCGRQIDPSCTKEKKMLTDCFSELLTEYQGNAPYRMLAIRNILSRLILLLSRLNCSKKPKRKEDKSPEASYIDTHFRESVTLASAAAAFGFSPSYFSRQFVRKNGITFQQYLNERRLSFAFTLLSSTGMRITQICYESGFNSHPYFCRCFKKRYGVSPYDVRHGRKPEISVF